MRPEDFIADRRRPFTGAEYIESLRDGRDVYFDGERVTDITTHPAFRNSVRSIARLYDALHDPETRDLLTCPTDTGSGGYTHKFFRVARSRDDMRGAQQAIAAWARLTYGWMGRTPDYKAAFSNTLGAFPEYYGAYADNARNWYKRAQEAMPFMNHAIVNPPIDRHRPPEEVKDVYPGFLKHGRCIGAANLRESCCDSDFSTIRGAPRCRQSVHRSCSNLKRSSGGQS
jgi:4-hydroxyphenylacetate 3-monooxygenase